MGPTFTGSNQERDPDTGRFYFGGFMRGCSLRLEPGRYLIRARAEVLDQPGAAQPFKRRLEPRFKRHLF